MKEWRNKSVIQHQENGLTHVRETFEGGVLPFHGDPWDAVVGAVLRMTGFNNWSGMAAWCCRLGRRPRVSLPNSIYCDESPWGHQNLHLKGVITWRLSCGKPKCPSEHTEAERPTPMFYDFPYWFFCCRWECSTHRWLILTTSFNFQHAARNITLYHTQASLQADEAPNPQVPNSK